MQRDIAGYRAPSTTASVPPHAYFIASAVFHYLGPAFAVLLFAAIDVPGVAWLRIATAAAAFAVWRRPWREMRSARPSVRLLAPAFGLVLAAMNLCFYFAIARLPLSTVGAIEFLGPIGLAAAGIRTHRNIWALILAVAGVYSLTQIRFSGEAVAYLFAFANCALFVLYVALGHRIAREGSQKRIDVLGAAMCVALIAITPVGVAGAVPAFAHPTLLLAGIVVGVTSSVIPYVCDQLAMARLPRSSFALLLSLLPFTATVIGIVVLHQIPTYRDIAGVLLIVTAIAIHRPGDSQ
jgi:inner membrane transporter RhtA